MKNFIITVLIIAAVAYGMAKFNPTKADFDAYIDKTANEKIEKSEGLEKVSEVAEAAVFSSAVKSAAVRKDYLIFSTYEADVFGKKVKYFGMFKTIAKTEEK